jgi:hypothetical protein
VKGLLCDAVFGSVSPTDGQAVNCTLECLGSGSGMPGSMRGVMVATDMRAQRLV